MTPACARHTPCRPSRLRTQSEGDLGVSGDADKLLLLPVPATGRQHFQSVSTEARARTTRRRRAKFSTGEDTPTGSRTTSPATTSPTTTSPATVSPALSDAHRRAIPSPTSPASITLPPGPLPPAAAGSGRPTSASPPLSSPALARSSPSVQPPPAAGEESRPAVQQDAILAGLDELWFCEPPLPRVAPHLTALRATRPTPTRPEAPVGAGGREAAKADAKSAGGVPVIATPLVNTGPAPKVVGADALVRGTRGPPSHELGSALSSASPSDSTVAVAGAPRAGGGALSQEPTRREPSATSSCVEEQQKASAPHLTPEAVKGDSSPLRPHLRRPPSAPTMSLPVPDPSHDVGAPSSTGRGGASPLHAPVPPSAQRTPPMARSHTVERAGGGARSELSRPSEPLIIVPEHHADVPWGVLDNDVLASLPTWPRRTDPRKASAILSPGQRACEGSCVCVMKSTPTQACSPSALLLPTHRCSWRY